MNRIARLIPALGAIFVGIVVAGCGTAVPGDSVAVVAGNPITSQALAHWGYIAAQGEAASVPGSPVIVPDPPNYTKCVASLRKIAPSTVSHTQLVTACMQQFTQVMQFLVMGYWVQGQAAAEHLTVTPAQVQAKFNTEKSQAFKAASQFQTFLKSTGQTEQDILYRIRLSLLETKLATPAAVAAYYKAHAASYSTPEKRNVRIILTKTLAQANAAKAALGSGHSWKSTAKQYSTDPATKNTGGLLTDVVNGEEPTALNAAIFSAPHLKLLGPIKSPFGYYVAEVTDIMPASTEPVSKASAAIKSQLVSEAMTTPPWASKWKKKTTCRSGFEIPQCSNYTAPKTTSTTTPTPSTTTAPSSTATVTTPTPTITTTTPKKK